MKKLSKPKYIVVYTLHGDERISDFYTTFENEIDAIKHYNDLREREDLFSASVVVPIRSTDYEGMQTLNINGSEVYVCEREER